LIFQARSYFFSDFSRWIAAINLSRCSYQTGRFNPCSSWKTAMNASWGTMSETVFMDGRDYGPAMTNLF
jgi:hypothetical protein